MEDERQILNEHLYRHLRIFQLDHKTCTAQSTRVRTTTNSKEPANVTNPMARQKTRLQTIDSNRSTRKQMAISPAEPAPRFDELPTAERNVKTAKGEHQKSPEAQEQERREQTSSTCGAKEGYREIRVLKSWLPSKSTRHMGVRGHKNHMDYNKKKKVTESDGEADVSQKIDVKQVNQF
eukprot:jgi/Phyca11/14339/fgenesh1_pg.PHYCAscaffold_7_\